MEWGRQMSQECLRVGGVKPAIIQVTEIVAVVTGKTKRGDSITGLVSGLIKKSVRWCFSM